MKISNNALNFLLAQYRAIFKRAYVKGIASAVMLTAALAAGQAQAATANADQTLKIEDFASGSVGAVSGTVTIASKVDLDKLTATQIATNKTYLGNHIFNGSGAQVTIEGKSGTNIIINDGTSQDLKVQNGASLTLTNTGNANTVIYGGDSGNSGTLTVSGTGSTVTLNAASAWFNKLTISDNATIKLEGAYTEAAAANYGQWQYFSAMVGQNDGTSTSGSGTITASTLNLGDASFFGANKDVQISGSKIVFDGTAVTPVKTATGKDVYASAFINAGVGTTTAGTITIASGTDASSNPVKSTLTVNPGKWGALYANTIKVSDSIVNIGSGATFIMDGDFAGTAAADEGTHDQVTLTLDDVHFDNKGTAIIGNATSGGTATVSGTTTLTGNVKNYAQVSIKGDGTTSGKLIVSADQLTKEAKASGNGWFAGKSGSIIVSGDSAFSQATLQIEGSDVINITEDLNITSGTTPGNVGLGQIGIHSGTIAGEHFVLNASLKNKLGTDTLALDSDVLEVGNDEISKLSDLGVEQFTAHDRIVLTGKDNKLTVDKNIYLSRDFYNKTASGDNILTSPAGVGTIEGANLTLSGSAAAAELEIKGGAWENANQSLTITSGTLTVGAALAKKEDGTDNTTASTGGTDGKTDTPWNYYKNGNPASLTWTGKFEFAGASDDATKASVAVTGASGANATLDLTQADIEWGAGNIVLSGVVEDGVNPYRVSKDDYFTRGGLGILKLTDDRMTEYLGLGSTAADKIKTKMTAEKGGLILVEGGINQAINVNKFENKAANSATAGNINLSGGMMFVTGDLDLVTGVATTGPNIGDPTDVEGDVKALTFNGVLGADSITLNNESTSITADDKGTDADKVTVSGGTLAVASSFSSDNHVVEFVSGAGLLLDTNGFLAQYDASTIGESGTVNVDKLVFNGTDGGSPNPKASKLDVQTGDWTIGSANALGDIDLQGGAGLSVGPGYEEFIRTGVGASLTADNLGVAANATASVITIEQGGSAKFNTVQAEGATIEVGEDSTFEITGILDSDDFVTENGTTNVSDTAPATLDAIGDYDQIVKQAGIALSGADIQVNGGTFILGDTAARALVTLDPNSGDTVDAVKINTGLDGAKFTLSEGGVLRLDFKAAEGDDKTVGLAGVNGGKALTAKQAADLKKELIEDHGGKINLGSYINVGDLALGMKYDSTNMTAEWADVKDFIKIESDVTNDDLVQLLILNAEDGLAGQFGAVSTTKNTTTVEGSLGLHQARAFDGSTEKFFASQVVNGERVAAGLSVKNDSTLALYGEGTVGTLEGAGTNTNSTVLFKAGDLQAGETVVKPINKNSYAISNMGRIVADNAVRVEGKAEAGAIEVGQSFTAESLELDGGNGISTVFGTLDTKNLTLTTTGGASSTNQLLVAGGTVKAVDTALASGVTLKVGQDASTKVQNNPDTTIDETASYSGIFETTRLALNDGLLIVDPEYDQPTALASIRNFADAKDAEYTDKSLVGTADGSIFVGQNSALGIGTESADELAQVIAKYQTNGHLSDAEDRLGAIVYLDGIVSIENNKGLVMTNQSIEDFVTYYNGANGTQTDITNANPTIANTIYFGDGSALMATADAIKAAGKQNQALVTLETTDGKLIADGGEVIISGDLRANPDHQYKLFADQGTGTNGDWVKVVDTEGKDVAAGAGIDVTTENGFLTGHIDNTNGGTISLSVNKAQAYSIMNGASDPVVQTLIAYAQGYNSEIRDENGNVTGYDDLYLGYYDTGAVDGNGDPIMAKDTEAYSNYFLAASIEQGNGAAAEAAARLGVYGGAPQAAIKAGQSSTDAIAARFGIGSAISNLTVAGNTQGAALWLAPVYKTSDSDGFDAQGVDYGVNVDLYGVALGADYTLANGISFGAMFNVGSGEVDGEGAASPVSNDFDYYGFGAYAGYTIGQFSVVGDISYTVADNEVEASTSVDHIGAQMDSTNLSVGVTGKYDLSFNGVNVTPHVGLRYSNIDLDDYTIDGNDVIASADSDKLNLFSIPVGVTIAKEFKGESWTVAPSFDLTLTGQFGDDELDGSVSWAGISNLTTDTTTEVFDNFTYGATLGVDAQSVGGVALGINVGYTGSSNVDEFGVNANARFVF